MRGKITKRTDFWKDRISQKHSGDSFNSRSLIVSENFETEKMDFGQSLKSVSPRRLPFFTFAILIEESKKGKGRFQEKIFFWFFHL